MTLSGRTSFQRCLDTGQPYTRVFADKRQVEVEVEIDGKTEKGFTVEDCVAVRGYTYEESLQSGDDEDGEPVYALDWLEHDLGQQPTLGEAHQAAAGWRESLSGAYEIR